MQYNLEMIEENISWEVCGKLIGMISETTQAPGALIFHKIDTYEGTDSGERVSSFTYALVNTRDRIIECD